MANVARPPMRPSSELRQTRLAFAPVAPDDGHRHNATIATRRTSRTGPPPARTDDDKPATNIHLAPARPAPPARTNSRKRPAAALSADAPGTRPPTKVTVTQPHGELLRILNGVTTSLGLDVDAVPSGGSTPRPGSAGKLAVPAPGSTSQDKRSLRSHDGGSRLKSDLPTYFANYDDIIAGLPKPSGMLSVSYVTIHGN